MPNDTIPADFPVTVLTAETPILPGDVIATCGTCDRSWNDAIVTSYTPAPAGRCPFEHWHKAPDEPWTVAEILADSSARFTVAGYSGIAFYPVEAETAPDADTEWSGIENETGFVIMTMVGDDRRHVIDPDDVTRIADDDYCAECGQLGCGGDFRDS